ncbi:Alpha/Beta hydrolase protein [Armillaria novae-zelandiae]|uniref:Alpha/Beta hydrolase protein n=1 Tax=Armillaria novae-zelandiae TaxID=153914 RepID=A0AA39NMT6_9AGAR|nr:Alpha/Beta hydrolase protein [Armillaria novae-zelandiae]
MLPAPAEIIYQNLGSFFATRGFITVVPDYRLIDSGVQFPGAAQDVCDAMQWVVDNLPFPNSDVYVLGHSAGAMNMFTILALPELYSPTLHPCIKGAILLSGCYTFKDIPADMKDSVRMHYGEDAEANQRVPLALLESASVPTLRLLLGIGERDIPCLDPAMNKFSAALKEKGLYIFTTIMNGVITCNSREWRLTTSSCIDCFKLWSHIGIAPHSFQFARKRGSHHQFRGYARSF